MKKRESLNIETEAWIVYGLLQNLQYEIYFALSEFVDNSVQSFLDNRDKLENDFVSVKINYEDKADGKEFIRITDDAGGILDERFDNAFRLTDPEGLKGTLNEFGLGMKMASLWLGSKFTVKTSAIGENYATTVIFDLEHVQKSKANQIDGDNLYVEKEDKDKHYTILTIEQTKHFPRGGNIASIKTHLSDIYRTYLREGTLNLTLNDQKINAPEPVWLNQVYWDNDKSPYPTNKEQLFEWKKDFYFELPEPYEYAKGYIGLTEKMQRAVSGLVIFRRGRAVYGTGPEEDRFRPKGLFGPSNQQKYARLFGEVHFGENAPVSSNKRLLWDQTQSIFILKLKQVLEGDTKKFKSFLDGDLSLDQINLEEILPIHQMGTKYRSDKMKKISAAKIKEHAQKATESTSNVFKLVNEVVDPLIENPRTAQANSNNTDNDKSLAINSINVNFSNQDWHVTFKVLSEPSRPLYIFRKTDKPYSIELSINSEHPFTKNFINHDGQIMNAFFRIASGLALAEIVSEQTQHKEPSAIRHNFNSIMDGSLSRKK
jgi:hypothetical protein